MQAIVHNQKGEKVDSVKLPEEIFGLRWNSDLVHQVVTAMQANARQGTADSKGRGEVRGGGKKPWRQKGTGRARHGSIRSPLWRGGGVTHGPTSERNYTQKINKKMKAKALGTVLAQKQREGEILWLEDLNLPQVKTKTAQAILERLALVPGFESLNYKQGKRALVALPETRPTVVKSFRNIKAVAVEAVRNLNPVELLRYRFLILSEPAESLKQIHDRIIVN